VKSLKEFFKKAVENGEAVIMTVRNKTVWSWALGGFSIGTIVALAYVASGASLVLLNGGWSRVALYPGFIVGFHAFDVVGYSAAVTLGCLTVGAVYSTLALAVGTALGRIPSLSRL